VPQTKRGKEIMLPSAADSALS